MSFYVRTLIFIAFIPFQASVFGADNTVRIATANGWAPEVTGTHDDSIHRHHRDSLWSLRRNPAFADSLTNTGTIPGHPDEYPVQPGDHSPSHTYQRTGKNALFVELLGNGINVYTLNYERALRSNFHARIGASWIGYSDQLRYENRGKDLFFDLYTIPASVSVTLFEGFSQLELGAGLTFFSMKFEGGPFDIGYHDMELGKRYRGLALSTIIGYRVSIHNYLFRIGLSPQYMFTLDRDISGFFTELKERGAFDLYDYLEFQGFRIIPGISFGRTF